MKTFKTISEVYHTGVPYIKEVPVESSHSTLGNAYLSLYTESDSIMSIPNFGSGSVNWSKYRKRLIELVSSEDVDIKIHKSKHGKYGIQEFNSDIIVNRDEIIEFVNSMQAGTAPKSPSWPDIEIRDGLSTIKISVGHLQKSGQFREEKEGQSSTEVKEGLVSLFFALNHNIPVTKENFDQVRDQLRGAIEEQPEGETKPALEELLKFVANIEGRGDKAQFRHELNQPLSQAATMLDSPYKNWLSNRSKIFHDVREAGRIITKYPADKWNPGDIYFVNPELEGKVEETLQTIRMNPGEESNLNLLNDLFITEWGNIDRPLVAVSLKFKNAQGGKAKDFLKKFIDEGTKDKPYNMDEADLALDEPAVAAEIMRLRESISNHINAKGTDVRIVFDTTNDTVELERNPKRMREKFASLKLIDFLFDRADAGGLDDVIVGAIGFGLSLAGVNPTFFKVIANTQGTAIADPEKFSEKGAIALYPVEGDDDPMIYIKDNNTSNKVQLDCNIELGNEIKGISLSARSNGYKQSTLEIERVR
jgi:hypothetical protein